MLSFEEMIRRLNAAHELVERALAIVTSPPFYKFIGNPEFCYLKIYGEIASLRWPTTETSYGDTTLENASITFPAALMLLDDGQLKTWQEDEVAKTKAAEAKDKEARKAQEFLLEQRRANELLTIGVVLAGKRYKLVEE